MLGVDAALDGVAGNCDRLSDDIGELFARGDAELRFDEVDACNHFGYAMFHLDAGVHLDEVDLAVFVHQELDGAGVPVADVLEALLDGRAEFGAQLRA